MVGIGATVTRRPLPHHPAYRSVAEVYLDLFAHSADGQRGQWPDSSVGDAYGPSKGLLDELRENRGVHQMVAIYKMVAIYNMFQN
jgi:hypothetical protein